MIVRIFIPNYKIIRKTDLDVPAVYLVHHQNLWGPVISLAWLDIPARMWVLNVFFNFNACFKQYYNYTFTKRFGIPKIIAAIIAFPISLFVSGLMHIMSALPVYRGSRDIVKTFNASVLALENGQNILICPDIDYSDSGSEMGEMYKGFLHIERKYAKKTGNHVPFVPIRIDKRKRLICIGDAIYFDEKYDFRQGKAEVYIQLKSQMG